MSIIQKKIESGEGYLEVEELGLITAKEYDRLTDPQWDKTLEDYQDRINFLNNEFKIDEDKITNEIHILNEELNNIQNELETDNLKNLYKKLKDEEKRFDLQNQNKKIIEKEENKLQNDINVKTMENQIYFLTKDIHAKISKKKQEIDRKFLELNKLKNNLNLKMQEISKDLIDTRKPLNLDYKKNQTLKIINKPVQNDYMPINNESDKLVLKTFEYKLNEAKEIKKKEITTYLINKYPEEVINNTINKRYEEEIKNIDILDNIENIRKYKANS